MKLLILLALVTIALAAKKGIKHPKIALGGPPGFGKLGKGGHGKVHHLGRRDVDLVGVNAVPLAPAPPTEDFAVQQDRSARGLLSGLFGMGGFGHGGLGHGGFGHGGFGGHGGFEHDGFGHGGFGHGGFRGDFGHHHHHQQLDHHGFGHNPHHF